MLVNVRGHRKVKFTKFEKEDSKADINKLVLGCKNQLCRIYISVKPSVMNWVGRI